jgi:hypothetical protein
VAACSSLSDFSFEKFAGGLCLREFFADEGGAIFGGHLTPGVTDPLWHLGVGHLTLRPGDERACEERGYDRRRQGNLE